jgi:hypothetical protein
MLNNILSVYPFKINTCKHLAVTKKPIYILLILLSIGLIFFSCEKDNNLTKGDSKLAFSIDTLMFDTIFTTIGSTTQSFKVINPYNQSIQISSIKLAGGDKSPYRLNIDGDMKNSVSDVVIPPRDSIYIFVEVTVDPNGVNQPMVVKDSIVFITNNNLQDIKLMAWGQDFVPIKGEVIGTSTWTAEKPYLIYDYALVDSNQILTIEPGARIYFHDKAGLYGKGAIIAQGTPEKPIIFKTDRLEKLYDDVPSKWFGIVLFPNETKSIFENVEIKNATIGLQVGTIEYPGPANVKLHNVKIEHISYAGIFALKSNIEATNTLVADCGYYCVALLIGGSYEFTHCTVSNYWGGYSNRTSQAVVISNQLLVESENTLYLGDLNKATWNNSIIWGNLSSEILFLNSKESAYNFRFDHCLVKLSDSVDVTNTDNFISLTKNKDPKFDSINVYNYVPDSLSPVRDIGARIYGEKVPFDLNQVSRLSDNAPDLGAYEYIFIPKKEK